MHAIPDLTPAAMKRWSAIPLDGREAIVGEVWCSACTTGGGICGARGELHPSGDIILRGTSPVCGGNVCRVIETGETMGKPDEFP